jgi:hypothetical protein
MYVHPVDGETDQPDNNDAINIFTGHHLGTRWQLNQAGKYIKHIHGKYLHPKDGTAGEGIALVTYDGLKDAFSFVDMND